MAEQLDQMRIELHCVKCGQRMEVPVRWMGRLVRCTGCQTANRVGRPEDQTEKAEGLRLPARVSHARYLDEAEQQAAATTSAAALTTEPARRWGWGVWLLIAANAAVAIGAAALIVMKIMRP